MLHHVLHHVLYSSMTKQSIVQSKNSDQGLFAGKLKIGKLKITNIS